MSIILITHHNESIYDMFKEQPKDESKQKLRFKTMAEKLRKFPRPDFSVPTKKYGVMGVANLEIPDPTQFLKKKSGEPCYVKVTGPKEPKKPCLPHKRPEVPKTKEVVKEYIPPKRDKDFVVRNIEKVKDQPGKEPTPYLVLDKFGNKEPLSVLEPIYKKGPYCGTTPPYLKKRIRQREIEYQLKKDKKSAFQPLCRYITKHRREELINALKQNWETLQHQYQGLPMLTDTIPKVLRKSALEKKLKQLEKFIVLFEKHPYIYVYEDNVIP